MTTLEAFGKEIAFAPRSKSAVLSGLYQSELGALRIEWCRWSFDSLYWSHGSALLFLQGASIQQVLHPWLVLRADPRPQYDPRPGANRVVLAELFETPPELTQRQLFELLLPEAGEGTPIPF